MSEFILYNKVGIPLTEIDEIGDAMNGFTGILKIMEEEFEDISFLDQDKLKKQKKRLRRVRSPAT